MVLLDIIMFFLCIGILYTLRMIRSIFRPIEKVMYVMVIIIAIEQIHSAILDNFKLIKFSETLSDFFFYKMSQLIVFPIATMWLLYSFFNNKIGFLLKILFLGIWLSGLTGYYFLFQYLGVLKFTGWNFSYSIVMWYVVLVESFCFSLVFRKMLGKSDSRDPIPTSAIRHK